MPFAGQFHYKSTDPGSIMAVLGAASGLEEHRVLRDRFTYHWFLVLVGLGTGLGAVSFHGIGSRRVSVPSGPFGTEY